MGTDKTFSDSYYVSEKYLTSYKIPDQGLRSLLDLESIKEHERFSSFLTEREEVVYTDKVQIPAIVLEVTNDYMILNCLVDGDNMIFQRRKFDIAPIKEKFEIVEGDGLIITIITNPGERSISYQKNNLINALLKEPEDRFSRFAGTSLFPER